MNYATWKLNFESPDYGTGPEDAILKTGKTAEAGWVNGDVTDGGTIMGYVGAPIDELALTQWHVKNITQGEALAFCQAINPAAYLAQDGRVAAPDEELPLG